MKLRSMRGTYGTDYLALSELKFFVHRYPGLASLTLGYDIAAFQA
jgi:hypothetical protein